MRAIKQRGTSLPPRLRSFVTDAAMVYGAPALAKKLGVATTTIFNIRDGFRVDVAVALKILDLSRFLGADRQQWLSRLPIEEPPSARSHRRTPKAQAPPPEPPAQGSLF
jgi:hypothetical protein